MSKKQSSTETKGRQGSSGHQNLIRMASLKLLNEVLGKDFLTVHFVRENPLDIKTESRVEGFSGFSGERVAAAEVRMYADVACAVLYDPNAKWGINRAEADPELVKIVNKHFADGNMQEYRRAVKTTYGAAFYIIECETNPNSNLLRDGPRLTSYKLIKQQNNNLKLILAVFKGTKIDNPEIFDAIWEFPRKEEAKS